MTPDGISTADWDRVRELALEVVNSSAADDSGGSERPSGQLRALLDERQEKYGPLPSLLATRADYVERPEDQEYWLLAAYDQAAQRGDPKNLVWIAESLSRFYVETSGDRRQAEEWLGRLERHLQDFHADSGSGACLSRDALARSGGGVGRILERGRRRS